MRGEPRAGGQVYADGTRLQELSVGPLHPRIVNPGPPEVFCSPGRAAQLAAWRLGRWHRREGNCETGLPLR